MDNGTKFVDTTTGEVFIASLITDTKGNHHRADFCMYAGESGIVDAPKDNTDWNQLRNDMIREIMYARCKDCSLDLPWATVAPKVSEMVDAFIAEMQKGVRR